MRVTIGLALSVGTVVRVNTLIRLQRHVQVVHRAKQLILIVVELPLVLVLLAIVIKSTMDNIIVDYKYYLKYY